MNMIARFLALSCLCSVAHLSHSFESSDEGTYAVLDTRGLITSRAIRISADGTGYRFETTQPDGSWVGAPCQADGCALRKSTPTDIERFFGKANEATVTLIRLECWHNMTLAFCRFASHRDETAQEHVFVFHGAAIAIRVVKVAGDAELFRARIDPAKKTYLSACAACHAVGAAGAPRLNRRSDWESRLRQSKEMLHLHVSTGFRACPPRGGDPSLTSDQLWDVLDFMTAHVGGRVGR